MQTVNLQTEKTWHTVVEQALQLLGADIARFLPHAEENNSPMADVFAPEQV